MLRIVAALVLVLIAARLLLPFVALRAVNNRLAGLDGYAGRIGEADFRVMRGGFVIGDIVFSRTAGDAGEFRLEVEKANVSFSWIQLARGRLSAEIEITRPAVFYSAGRSREEPAAEENEEESKNPRDVLAEWRRFEIKRLEIVDGATTLEWPVGERAQKLRLVAVNARFAGLGNDPAARRKPAATGMVEARFAGGGALTAEAEGAPLAMPPRVHARTEVDEFDLTLLNPLLIDALGTDVKEGSLRITAEFRAAEGYYEGHVAPFVSDARFTRPGNENTSFGEGVRAAALDVAAKVLSNDDTERVASKVPFSGRFEDGEVDGWTAFTTLLGNAFGEALRAGRADEE